MRFLQDWKAFSRDGLRLFCLLDSDDFAEDVELAPELGFNYYRTDKYVTELMHNKY